jgi:hypothetical protein
MHNVAEKNRNEARGHNPGNQRPIAVPDKCGGDRYAQGKQPRYYLDFELHVEGEIAAECNDPDVLECGDGPTGRQRVDHVDQLRAVEKATNRDGGCDQHGTGEHTAYDVDGKSRIIDGTVRPVSPNDRAFDAKPGDKVQGLKEADGKRDDPEILWCQQPNQDEGAAEIDQARAESPADRPTRSPCCPREYRPGVSCKVYAPIAVSHPSASFPWSRRFGMVRRNHAGKPG